MRCARRWRLWYDKQILDDIRAVAAATEDNNLGNIALQTATREEWLSS